jgi:RimJ/RimL family protein N-acetyltransferase
MTGDPNDILPDRVEGADGLLLREWRAQDAEELAAAVKESRDHLRPWMPWADEPIDLAGRRAQIAAWQKQRRDGGDALYGIFVDGRVAGGCGLHRRIGPAGLEIGYWVRAGCTRRRVATRAVGLLTGAAFALPAITHVEIHHDRANVASAGIPRALGYAWLGERPDRIEAPGEEGVEVRWRMTRDAWAGGV